MTPEQRNALHLFCDRLAEALNDGGFDQKAVLEKKVLPLPNTKESVKELVRAAQAAMYPREDGKKPSTNEMTNGQLGKVIDAIGLWTGTNFGISVPFPSQEEK